MASQLSRGLQKAPDRLRNFPLDLGFTSQMTALSFLARAAPPNLFHPLSLDSFVKFLYSVPLSIETPPPVSDYCFPCLHLGRSSYHAFSRQQQARSRPFPSPSSSVSSFCVPLNRRLRLLFPPCPRVISAIMKSSRPVKTLSASVDYVPAPPHSDFTHLFGLFFERSFTRPSKLAGFFI